MVDKYWCFGGNRWLLLQGSYELQVCPKHQDLFASIQNVTYQKMSVGLIFEVRIHKNSGNVRKPQCRSVLLNLYWTQHMLPMTCWTHQNKDVLMPSLQEIPISHAWVGKTFHFNQVWIHCEVQHKENDEARFLRIIYICVCHYIFPDTINYATCNICPVMLMFFITRKKKRKKKKQLY